MNLKNNDEIDHTEQLEHRFKAIQICVTDTCSFFSEKDGNVFTVKRCLYCEYAKFKEDVISEESVGLCKFKP